MPKFENLEAFIRGKYGTQGALAEKLGIGQNTISAWVRGKNRVSAEIEKKLRRLDYDGPMPGQEVKEPLPQSLTREEFAEWRGYWKAGTEKLLERLEDLTRRGDELEKKALK